MPQSVRKDLSKMLGLMSGRRVNQDVPKSVRPRREIRLFNKNHQLHSIRVDSMLQDGAGVGFEHEPGVTYGQQVIMG